MINSLNINAEQVKTGMAGAYRYCDYIYESNVLRPKTMVRKIKWGCGQPLIPLNRGNGDK